MKVSTNGITIIVATIGAAIVLFCLQPTSAEAQRRATDVELEVLERLIEDPSSITPADERVLEQRSLERLRESRIEEREQIIRDFIEELEEQRREGFDILDEEFFEELLEEPVDPDEDFSENLRRLLDNLEQEQRQPRNDDEPPRDGNPNRLEICNNGRDDDGDGVIDEADCVFVEN